MSGSLERSLTCLYMGLKEVNQMLKEMTADRMRS